VHPVRALVLSGVARVQPQLGETLGQTIAHGDIQQELDALLVLDLCAVELGHEHQALGVNEQMTLAPLDLLGPYSIAALFGVHARGLDRLAIHDGRAGLRVPLQANPHPL
jgi:hypothetical protein